MKKVIYIEPGKRPVIELVEKINLDLLQSKVDGLIDIIGWSNNIDIVINDEMLLREDYEINFVIDIGNNIVPIYGPALLISCDENGNSIGLTDEQIKEVMSLFPEKQSV